MKKLLLLLLLLSFHFAEADVITPGIVNKGFMIVNIKKFKQFTFTFTSQNYKYNQGYRPNGQTVTTIEGNTIYYASSRGDKSFIIATDSTGKKFTSTIEVGGEGKFATNVKYFTEAYEIVSVKNDIITLKKVKEIVTTNKGVKETKLAFFDNNGSYGLLWLFIASGIALGGLFLLFKKAKTNTYST